jgi:hypothetical protein
MFSYSGIRMSTTSQAHSENEHSLDDSDRSRLMCTVATIADIWTTFSLMAVDWRGSSVVCREGSVSEKKNLARCDILDRFREDLARPTE